MFEMLPQALSELPPTTVRYFLIPYLEKGERQAVNELLEALRLPMGEGTRLRLQMHYSSAFTQLHKATVAVQIINTSPTTLDHALRHEHWKQVWCVSATRSVEAFCKAMEALLELRNSVHATTHKTDALIQSLMRSIIASLLTQAHFPILFNLPREIHRTLRHLSPFTVLHTKEKPWPSPEDALYRREYLIKAMPKWATVPTSPQKDRIFQTTYHELMLDDEHKPALWNKFVDAVIKQRDPIMLLALLRIDPKEYKHTKTPLVCNTDQLLKIARCMQEPTPNAEIGLIAYAKLSPRNHLLPAHRKRVAQLVTWLAQQDVLLTRILRDELDLVLYYTDTIHLLSDHQLMHHIQTKWPNSRMRDELAKRLGRKENV